MSAACLRAREARPARHCASTPRPRQAPARGRLPRRPGDAARSPAELALTWHLTPTYERLRLRSGRVAASGCRLTEDAAGPGSHTPAAAPRSGRVGAGPALVPSGVPWWVPALLARRQEGDPTRRLSDDCLRSVSSPPWEGKAGRSRERLLRGPGLLAGETPGSSADDGAVGRGSLSCSGLGKNTVPKSTAPCTAEGRTGRAAAGQRPPVRSVDALFAVTAPLVCGGAGLGN